MNFDSAGKLACLYNFCLILFLIYFSNSNHYPYFKIDVTKFVLLLIIKQPDENEINFNTYACGVHFVALGRCRGDIVPTA